MVQQLFGGVDQTLSDPYGGQVHEIFSDGDHVVVEHTGSNQTPDGPKHDNNYCWVFTFGDGLIRQVHEYMDTQLVTETFATDPS